VPRRATPPPEFVSVTDIIHVVFAVLMVPLGLAILARTLQVTITPLGIGIGLAFSAFGIYRLRTAWFRYRWLRQLRKSSDGRL
jgi:hypothetical protein